MNCKDCLCVREKKERSKMVKLAGKNGTISAEKGGQLCYKFLWFI